MTIAIPTWNRARLLDRTLARLRELQIPAGLKWDVLVVDNNSPDDTQAVVKKHAAALPLYSIIEPRIGVANARNCVLENARGGHVVWTDDDVLVESDWLVEHLKAAERFPDAGFFGGTVDPWFAVEPPAWVLEHLKYLEGPFAIRRHGPEVRPLVEPETVFGANMAFRMRYFRDARFDANLGRSGFGLLSGEETELMERVATAGHYGVWVGSARVKHYIPAKRLTTRYVWKFFHGLGRTYHRLKPYDRTVARAFGAPRWLVRKYAVERAKSLALWPCRGDGWIRNFTEAAITRGLIDEFRAAEPARAAGHPRSFLRWN